MEEVYIVDRLEGDFVVCEKKDEIFVNIKKSDVPLSVKEGDILVCKDGKFEIDDRRTKERKKEIEDLTKDLWI